MLLPVAIVLAVMSVVMWRIEAQAFLRNLEKALLSRTTAGKVWAVVRSLPSLAPLAIDIAITSSLITMFGLAGGVTGAAMALAMSNTASFFIARQAMKMQRAASPMAHPPGVNYVRPVAPYGPTPVAQAAMPVPPFVEAYNKRFFAVLRHGLNKFEAAARPESARRCAPCTSPR